MNNEPVLAETVAVRGAGDDDIEAFTARPLGGARRGGVVVVHHMPGFDRGTKEIVCSLAADGFNAICMNLFHRDAPGADADDAAAASRANGGVPDSRFLGDADGSLRWLRALTSSNGRVAAVGFCSGGRQALLAAMSLDVQAVVNCYGVFVVAEAPPSFPARVPPLADRIGEIRAPVLGLFGNEDTHPTPAEVDDLERLLVESGKPYEFHRYDGAGHAFFEVDRPAYRVAAAVDGWLRIRDFLSRQLAGSED